MKYTNEFLNLDIPAYFQNQHSLSDDARWFQLLVASGERQFLACEHQNNGTLEFLIEGNNNKPHINL